MRMEWACNSGAAWPGCRASGGYRAATPCRCCRTELKRHPARIGWWVGSRKAGSLAASAKRLMQPAERLDVAS